MAEEREVHQLTDVEEKALKAVFKASAAAIGSMYEGVGNLIADLYEGSAIGFNDEATTTLAVFAQDSGDLHDDDVHRGTVRFRPPQTSANLANVHVRILTAQLVPGVPAPRVQAVSPGASHVEREQNIINGFFATTRHLAHAFRRAVSTGIMSPHFGLRLDIDTSRPINDRARVVALEASDCGYEPRHRRILWQTKTIQWAEIEARHRDVWLAKLREDPEGVNAEAPQPWDMMLYTEVFHEKMPFGGKDSYKGCPRSVFIRREKGDSRVQEYPRDLGLYTLTDDDEPVCPVVIGRMVEPAPNKDVSPPEFTYWIPTIRMIVEDLNALNMEIATLARMRLHNSATVSREAIAGAMKSSINGVVWIPVTASDPEVGVNSQVRPIENDSKLGEIVAVMAQHWHLLELISGVGPFDKQDAPSPGKTAFEAGAIVQAGQARKRDRIETVASAMSEIFQIHHANQRRIYKRNLKLPTGEVIQVPSPKEAQFQLRVDVVELAHLDQGQQVETRLTFAQFLANMLSVFPRSMPGVLKQQIVKIAEAMGQYDSALGLQIPEFTDTPHDRIIQAMAAGKPVKILDTDDPRMFLPVYTEMLEQFQEEGETVHVAMLEDAVTRYEQMLRADQARREEAQRAALDRRLDAPPTGPGLEGAGQRATIPFRNPRSVNL